MSTVYMIPAKLEHYTCMVDLSGLAGHPQEAKNVIHMMPCKPKEAVWMGLLGICRIHGTVEIAECVAKQVLELEPKRAAGYVVLPDLSAASAGGNLDLSEDVNHRERKKV
jgi:hypothetical protein